MCLSVMQYDTLAWIIESINQRIRYFCTFVDVRANITFAQILPKKLTTRRIATAHGEFVVKYLRHVVIYSVTANVLLVVRLPRMFR